MISSRAIQRTRRKTRRGEYQNVCPGGFGSFTYGPCLFAALLPPHPPVRSPFCFLSPPPGLVYASTKEGETGLHLVSISGSYEVAKVLVDAVAAVNARTTFDGVRKKMTSVMPCLSVCCSGPPLRCCLRASCRESATVRVCTVVRGRSKTSLR